jgi:phage terminase large subunit-like protein
MKKRTKTPDTSAPNGFRFDKDAADRACEFFEIFLKHVKGEWAGQPFVLSKWQRDEIIRPLFGWKRADGTRRYRTMYCEVPRKNAKSTTGAGIALYLLFSDGEMGAEVYSAAGDREQAAIIFEIAKQMVEQEPRLKSRCEIYRRSIVYPRTGSAYHVLSADVPTKHGKNSHGVIFDELHVQPNRHLYDVLKTSMGSRRQPLMVMFTTAGHDRESICWEEHSYALKVRDGIIKDDTYLPVIYSAADTDDWTDPKVWTAANPGLGISIKLAYLEEECERAKESPAYQNTFRNLYLDQWTEQSTRWIDMALWDACSEPVNERELEGRECYGGLDLASTTDIAAFVKLFPPTDDDQRWRVLCRFWVPKENMRKRSDRDRVPYAVWSQQELIEPTEGNIIDYDVIRKRIGEDGQRFNIREIAFDRWNATQLTTQLAGDGFTMVPFGQGFQSMAAPCEELRKLLVSHQLAHGGNEVLAWMASNVAVKQDPAGNLKPDKSKSSEKIDGIVALIMALGRAMVRPEFSSVYEFHGIETLG